MCPASLEFSSNADVCCLLCFSFESTNTTCSFYMKEIHTFGFIAGSYQNMCSVLGCILQWILKH